MNLMNEIKMNKNPSQLFFNKGVICVCVYDKQKLICEKAF